MILSLSLVSWKRDLIIPQKINLTIISGKRSKKSQEDTTKNKAVETLTSLRRDGQSKEDKQKITEELKPYIYWAIQ